MATKQTKSTKDSKSKAAVKASLRKLSRKELEKIVGGGGAMEADAAYCNHTQGASTNCYLTSGPGCMISGY